MEPDPPGTQVKYEVDTESGTRYIIDMDAKVMRRLPRATDHAGDPMVFVSDLHGDGEDLPFVTIRFEEGSPLYAVWNDGGHPNFRMSTTITAVRQIVQAASDQPA